jgi:hypothetical protein
VEAPSPAEDKHGQEYMAKYAAEYAKISLELGIPVELLIACSLTESAPKNPETCVRLEPGYVKVFTPGTKTIDIAASDSGSPSKISAGFCQLLISTVGM